MTRLRLIPLAASAMLVLLTAVLAFAAAPVSAAEPGCTSPAMYVVGHEDDTLLFQSPSVLQDIQSERCVRSVFLTAGDAGRSQSYWGAREEGVEDAYAQMAGVANQWTSSVIAVNGHSIHLETLKARPSISIVYMRLPDGGIDGPGFPLYGNQSLMKLWNSQHQNEKGTLPQQTSITAVDNSATYSYDDLIETLEAMVESYEPRQIYTQNYTVPLISADHPDHVATGLFIQEASRRYPAAHRLLAFEDYEIAAYGPNVTGALQGGKSAAFYKYASHDSDACASEGACSGTSYASWLQRQYSVAPETTGVVANAGFMQLSEINTPVTLDGSESSREDGGPLTYAWTQTGGPAVTLSSSTAQQPTFTTPSHPTKLTFSLTVKGGSTTSAPDTVVVKVPSVDPTPTAIAGTTQTAASGATVNLNGGESWDPNSASLQYSWLQTSGPLVTLTGSSTATPSFTAPTGPTTLKFSLMVSNGAQTSAPSVVTINVKGIAPGFTSSASAPFTTGVAGSFKVTTTGSPTPTLTREGALPTGLTFTANADGTATIAGTPAASAAAAGLTQAYPIKVKATNSEDSTFQTLTLNVHNPGTPPSFSTVTGTTFTTGLQNSFTVDATGNPDPTVTKVSGTLPTGLSLTSNPDGSLTLSGTAAAAAAEPGKSQNYPLTFEASSAAGSITQPFTLTVTNLGTIPAFNSATSAPFTTGITGSFTITTTGIPAAAITQTSGTLPTGLKLTDNGDGTATVSGTPAASVASPGLTQPYSIGLKAKNAAGEGTQTLTVSVHNPGIPPAIGSDPSTTFTTGVAGSFTVTSSGDPTAALSVSGALPGNVKFTDNGNGTATISGTPEAAAAEPGKSKNYALTLKAKSAAGEFTQPFTLTVHNPGTKPSFSSNPSTTFTVGVAKTFTISTSGNPLPALEKSGTLAPGLEFVDNGDGTAKITGTATNAAAPPADSLAYPLTITATSLAGEKSQPFTLTVTNPGTQPSFSSAAATGFTTGVEKSFTIDAGGAPDPTVTKVSGTLPTGLSLTSNPDGSLTLSGTAAAAAAEPGKSQNYPLTFEAKSAAGKATQTFTLTVTNVGTIPAFNSATSAPFTTGITGSFTITTTGIPAAAITQTSGTLPAGLKLTDNGNGTAKVSGTPEAPAAPAGQTQSYSIGLKAKNAAGEDLQTLTLEVHNPGTKPSFSSNPSTTFTVGVAKTFTISTSGNPLPALEKSGTLAPGLEFVDNGDGTAKITGTATNAAAPPADSLAYPLTITATSLAGEKSQPFTLTVTNPGTQPSFSSAAATGFTTGVEKSFTIDAGGAPDPTVTKVSGTLPTGLSLTSNPDGSLTLSGTAAAAAAEPGKSQNYPLTFEAKSAAGKATQTFTLTVTNVGTIPAFNSATSAPFTTGITGSFTITTTGIPAAAITQTSGTLPAGLKLTDNGNGTAKVSGTPEAPAAPAGQTQSYSIGLKAKNAAGEDLQTLTLEVHNPGTKPSFSSNPSTTFTVGVAKTFTISTSGNPLPALEKSGTLAPGLEFVDNGDGTAKITGTATNAAAPPADSLAYPLTITATSLAGEKSQPFTLTVTNPGTQPSFSSAAATGFTTGVGGSFNVTTNGAPTAALSVTAATLPEWLSFSDNGDGSATIAGTPPVSAAPAASSKNYGFTIKAKSGAGEAAQSFTLTVTNPGNAGAVTSAPSTTFTTGVAGSFEVTSSGNPTATVGLAGQLPPGVSFTAHSDGSGTIAGTPTAAAAPPASSQNYAVTISAVNGAGKGTQAFTLKVNNPGTPPEITSDKAATFTTGVAATFTITSTGSPTAALSRIEGELPDGLSFSDKGNGTATIAGTPATTTAPAAGSKPYTIKIKATSGAGTDTESLTLTVVNPGVKPTISTADATSFTTGTAAAFQVTSSGDPTATLSAIGDLPAGVSFSDKGDGTATIAGTPAASAAPAGSSKTYPITIKATNGAGNATQPFTITVVNPGTGPSITSAASTTFTTGAAGSFDVTATGDPAPALSVTGQLPPGVGFADAGNGSGTISGTPSAAAAAPGTSHAFTFTIKAAGAGTVNQTFTLTVVNPGVAPKIMSASSISFTTGVAASFEVSTDGDPIPALSRTGALPDGITFSSNGDGTATIAGTAAESAADPGASHGYPLTLKAKSLAGEDTQSFTLTVVNPGEGPSFSSAASVSFTTGVAKTFTIATAGNPVATLAKSGALPAGLVFADNGDGTATIFGTAAASAAPAGSSRVYPLSFEASLAAGHKTQDFQLTVVNTEQPVLERPSSGGESQPQVVAPQPKTPTVQPVTVTLSQGKVLLPAGRKARRVVRVRATAVTSVTCSGALPKGARCRVTHDHDVIIEATKAVNRTGTYRLSVHVVEEQGSVQRPLLVQILQPGDPALKQGRSGGRSL